MRRRCGVVLLFFVLATSTVLIACGSRPVDLSSGAQGGAQLALSLENIHASAAGARGVAVSPDGERVLITGSGPEGAGIYLAASNVSGAEGPNRISLGPAQLWLNGSSPSWAGDSDRVALIRDGDVWVASITEPEARAITSGMESARAPAFSADGQTVAFYSAKSGHQDIWVVSADGSGPAHQVTEAAMSLDDARFVPAWSPDSRSIAYVSNESDYWHDDIWVVDAINGGRRQVSRSFMAMSAPTWSPDGSRIAVFGTAKDEYWYEDLSDIYVIDPAAETERIVDMQVYATDATMRHRPWWSGDGRLLYFPYMERGSTNVWSVPAEGGVATRITSLEGSMSALHATPGAETLAFVHSTSTRGGEAYLLHGGGGLPRRVSSFSPEWNDVVAPQEISYRSFDGLNIQGFLYLPPDLEGGSSCPALVQVHGGGTNSYQRGLNLTEQYLASRGFVVLAINYRGSSGFGREFQDLAVEDWLYDQALDAGAAADFLRTLPYVTGKVGIYGGSYGGSMSLSAISLTPDKFDAAVPMRGAYSKRNTLEYTDRLGKIFSITGHGGTPEERPDTYAKSDVVARIKDITTPVLLMHGELDRRVPIQNFENAVAEFERLGKRVETVTYPDEGHGFRNPDNRIDMYSRLEEFFTRHLGVCATS